MRLHVHRWLYTVLSNDMGLRHCFRECAKCAEKQTFVGDRWIGKAQMKPTKGKPNPPPRKL